MTSRSYRRDLASSSSFVFPLVRDVSPTPSFLGSFVRRDRFPFASPTTSPIPPSVSLSLSNLPLTFTRPVQPIFSLPMHESIFTSACLSINPSRPFFYPSSFVSNPHLSYSSTHRSLRFTLPSLPAFLAVACLLFDSTAFLLACHRADARFLLSGHQPIPCYVFLSLRACMERGRTSSGFNVYIYIYICTYTHTYIGT